MNKLKKEINNTFNELSSMDSKTFNIKLEKHQNGEYASMLKDSNAINLEFDIKFIEHDMSVVNHFYKWIDFHEQMKQFDIQDYISDEMKELQEQMGIIFTNVSVPTLEPDKNDPDITNYKVTFNYIEKDDA